MQKSRSFSQGSLNSRSISSKINLFKEQGYDYEGNFNNLKRNSTVSQQKTILCLQINILSKKKSSINIETKRPVSKQASKTSRLPSAIEPKSSKKQILNFMVDSNELNPQKRFTLINLKQSILLQQLDSKAMEITRYSEKNSSLLNKKQTLQNKINSLKRQIAEQQKQYNDAKWACANLRNQIQLTQKRYDQKSTQRKQLTKKTSDTSKENTYLSKEVYQAQEESNYNKNHIQMLKDETYNLLIETINTNALLLEQQSVRIKIRDELNLQLKVMQNAAITYQELLSQKDHLRTEIDKSFMENKLQSYKKQTSKGSNLSINSNKR